MNILAGVITAVASFLWVVLEAEMARRDGMLTAADMKQKYPQYTIGLPFVYHGGMWSDLCILTPLAYWLVATYSTQWTYTEMVMFGIGGVVLSALFHWFYRRTPFPDSLAWKHEITRAGWLHGVYTAAGIAVIGLGLFATEHIAPNALIFLAVIIAIHVTVSGKVFLGLLNTYVLRRDWLPTLHTHPDQWFTLAFLYIVLILIVLCLVFSSNHTFLDLGTRLI